MVEANAQLQLITLPESTYGKYKELIRLTQYETMKQHWFGGEDPRLEFKREKIMAETMNETKVYKQLSDGSVPSYEKFKSVKKKIQESNKGIQVTPLTKKEQQQKTIDEYTRLQNMTTDKNL